MASNTPSLIFGGASIGWTYTSLSSVNDLLSSLLALGINQIDSAARYPPMSPGRSEQLLGEAQAAAKGFVIDTKVMCSGDSKGSLAREAVEKSVVESLARLRVEKVRVLYCHMPDLATPLEEQAAAMNEQVMKGRCEKIGVSNFSTQTLSRWLEICDERGYAKPQVYQGQYNLIGRQPEDELFPLLRKHGMTFTAYRALAGGFLTGAASSGATQGTRFSPETPIGQHFKSMYDKPALHDAMQRLKDAVAASSMKPTEAGLRWALYHSMLGAGDMVILGASKVAYLEENVKDIKGGPLPKGVEEAINALWEGVKDVAPGA